MIKARRAIGILTSVVVVCAGVVVLQTRAADEHHGLCANDAVCEHAARAQQASALAPTTAVPPAAPAKGATKPPAPGAPQVPEESATIRDDPTIVPDSKQSADNNVSFPNDT